jgi:hypothetical protein
MFNGSAADFPKVFTSFVKVLYNKIKFVETCHLNTQISRCVLPDSSSADTGLYPFRINSGGAELVLWAFCRTLWRCIDPSQSFELPIPVAGPLLQHRLILYHSSKDSALLIAEALNDSIERIVLLDFIHRLVSQEQTKFDGWSPEAQFVQY